MNGMHFYTLQAEVSLSFSVYEVVLVACLSRSWKQTNHATDKPRERLQS